MLEPADMFEAVSLTSPSASCCPGSSLSPEILRTVFQTSRLRMILPCSGLVTLMQHACLASDQFCEVMRAFTDHESQWHWLSWSGYACPGRRRPTLAIAEETHDVCAPIVLARSHVYRWIQRSVAPFPGTEPTQCALAQMKFSLILEHENANDGIHQSSTGDGPDENTRYVYRPTFCVESVECDRGTSPRSSSRWRVELRCQVWLEGSSDISCYDLRSLSAEVLEYAMRFGFTIVEPDGKSL